MTENDMTCGPITDNIVKSYNTLGGNMKKIGAIVTFILLLIGGVYAKDNMSDDISREDFISISGDTINESESADMNLIETTNVSEDVSEDTGSEDTGNTIVIEDDVQEPTTDKKSSPGFEYMMSFISLLSAVFTFKRFKF